MLMISKRKKIRYFIPLFLAAGVLIYTFFLIIPIFNSLRLSFYTGEGMSTPTEFVGFANYIKLFTKYPFDVRFFNAFKNTIKFFLIVTVVQNIAGFFMAVLLTRKFRGNTFFRRISFLPSTLSILVTGFLFKLLLNPIWGIFDKILAALGLDFLIRPWLGSTALALPVIALVVGWQWIGEAILFYSAGIDSIDSEILEAAKIDGAGPMAEVRYIIFPSILPIAGMVTILIFVASFTQFAVIYAMATSKGNPIYSTDVFGSLFYRVTFESAVRGGWGIGMGAAVATIILILVLIGVVFCLFLFRMKGSKE